MSPVVDLCQLVNMNSSFPTESSRAGCKKSLRSGGLGVRGLGLLVSRVPVDR